MQEYLYNLNNLILHNSAHIRNINKNFFEILKITTQILYNILKTTIFIKIILLEKLFSVLNLKINFKNK